MIIFYDKVGYNLVQVDYNYLRMNKTGWLLMKPLKMVLKKNLMYTFAEATRSSTYQQNLFEMTRNFYI